MPRSVVIKDNGGPNELKLVNVAEPPAPAKGQLLIKQTAIGVNYLDIYYRNGTYKSSKLPMVLGSEAAGEVLAVGEGVDCSIGQRVIYGTGPQGAYTDLRLVNANHVVGAPEDISDEILAASFSKALTAHFLLYRTFKVRPGDTILIHAVAGGTGQIMCQWAKIIGATVIGTVGSEHKIPIAKSIGCDYVIDYSKQDFLQEVMRITNNQGVPVVYDSVGKDTLMKSIKCLRTLGLLVSFGQSSGIPPSVNVMSLAQKSLFLTRPILNLYKSGRDELILTAIEIFENIRKGRIKVNVGNKYDLKDASKAHKDLESRKTTGSSILVV